MRVLLLHLDGKLPNIALMRISAHHKARGDEVTFRLANKVKTLAPPFYEEPFDRVYGSLIFEDTRPLAEFARHLYPGIILGGTGWDLATTVEQFGIGTLEQDYTIYPKYRHSIGFSQRGCRLRCPFCVVPRKEGAVSEVTTINGIWRGEGHPKEIALLDNDFFGQPSWRDRIVEIREGGFKVCFNQGINARALDDETAAAIASVQYKDDQFKRPRLYTAWDSIGSEKRLFAGLRALVRHGVRPDHLMVYMLIGFEDDTSVDGWEYRRAKLREFGARPYPMPFDRTAEAVGFARWVTGAYDKRGVSWPAWVLADYQPRKLGCPEAPNLFAAP